jgi:hypothetical protein
MAKKIEKYHIRTPHTFGEKRFATDICRTVKRIVEIHQLCTGKSVGSNHDASHELISLLAGICIDRASKNFQFAFYPLDPSKVLNILQKKALPIQRDREKKITSESVHGICCTIRGISREGEFEIMDWKRPSYSPLLPLLPRCDLEEGVISFPVIVYLAAYLPLVLMILVISWSFVEIHKMLNPSSVMGEVFICLGIFPTWLFYVVLIAVFYDKLIN